MVDKRVVKCAVTADVIAAIKVYISIYRKCVQHCSRVLGRAPTIHFTILTTIILQSISYMVCLMFMIHMGNYITPEI